MQLVALPGRNRQTEEWLRAVLTESALPTNGIVRYRHWESAVDADADFEAQCLASRSPALVIAKSLGTVVAARAFCIHQFRPQSAILIGTPFSAFGPKDLASVQQLAQGVETLFIQQAEDPGGSASQLGDSLRLSKPNVASVPGNDHLYADIAALAAIIQKWKSKAL